MAGAQVGLLALRGDRHHVGQEKSIQGRNANFEWK